MQENFRLEKGGLINRSKKISFKFNGKKYYGYEGDTIASALLANGVHLVGRSFKYHRPRGFFGAGVDEPYAIVQMYRNNEVDPNVRATEQELFEGLEAKSVNCWPSVQFDIGAINNFLNRFFPAGFYYKTFMWPKSFWYNIYEPIIRKAAGFGAASIKHDKERYEHKYEYCDLLITGSGPSGLASAYAAAQNGAKIILAEDKPRFGGSLLTSDVTIGNQSGDEWANKIISELKSMPNVIVKNRSQVFGYYDHNMLVMSERVSDHLPKSEKYTPKQRLWYIRAKEVIISSGSIERPLVFGNNDTPGVMLSSAAKEYMKVYGVLVGKNPIVFTNNDSGYETAIEFKKNGIDPLVLDTRKSPDSEIIKEAKELNIKIKNSYVVVAAKGYKKVKSADISKISDDKTKISEIENIKCDSICVSGFWTPSIHLASQSGNKTKFNEQIDAFIPNQKKQKESMVSYKKDINLKIPKVINNKISCDLWLQELQTLEEERDNEILSQSEAHTDFVNPVKVCTTINNVLDKDSIIIADGGDFVGTASYILRPPHPLSWLDPGPFGTLGVGGGFALGAKSAFPDKEVWIIYGDGASAFSLAEFDTFVRHKLPVIAIVGNDASWQQIAREQVDMLGRNIGTNLNNTDYHQVVEGYGAKGFLVTETSQLHDVLLQAKSDAKMGIPVLVNVRIGKTDFRKGSISV